jgi:beta-galactosidase/beta-glucuronidase
MRSVELHTIGEQAVVWRAYVLPSGTDFTLAEPVATPGSVDITLKLSSAADAGKTVSFTLAFDGGAAESHQGTVTQDGEVVLKGVAVPNPTLWSTDSPNLHTLTVEFRGGSITERFGLRSFGVDKETARLTINGKIIKLVGWNHHTQVRENTYQLPALVLYDSQFVCLYVCRAV